MMLNLHIRNSDDQVVYSTFPTNCLGCMVTCETTKELVKCSESGTKKRRGIIRSPLGSVYLCSDDKDLLKSSRIFKAHLDFLSSMLQELITIRNGIADKINEDTKRLLHNVISLNAHNMQEIYELVSQDLLTQKMASQIEEFTQIIESRPKDIALALIRMHKNDISMKVNFNVFKKLYDRSPATNFLKHPLHRVVLNVLHVFFQDFTDKGVRVIIDPCNAEILLDYESFQVALYHLIENSAKYIMNDSTLHISFPLIDEVQHILFDMISLEIPDSEKEKIFEEGYSGESACLLQLSGSGLGLGIIKPLLQLNNSELRLFRNVKPNKTKITTLAVYQNNQFEIKLSKPL